MRILTPSANKLIGAAMELKNIVVENGKNSLEVVIMLQS